jgi:hypothetical protein
MQRNEATATNTDSAPAPEITPQQEMVLQQTSQIITTVEHSNTILDGKMWRLVEAGALVVALIGGSSLAGLTSNYSTLTYIMIIAAFLMYAIIICLSLTSHTPRWRKAPGTTDWEELFQTQIHATVDECYHQTLSNQLEVISDTMKTNHRKAKSVKLAHILFGLEILSLLVAVLGS